jgi:hypothetical protein
VPSIAADPDRYFGRCVAIDGVIHGLFLFESVDGVYLQPRDWLNPSSSGFRIGLDNLFEGPAEDYRHVSIIGRVQNCGAPRDDAALLFVAGYCHYFNGVYVWIERLEGRRGRPFERRMGSYDRADYGDLEPAPDDWPHRATVDALAERFLDALRTRDHERLAGIHFRDVGLEWEDDEAALLKFLLAYDSPFAAVRGSTMPPERIVLVERSRLEPGDAADDYSATVCFCRERSCAGRWPIATFDADNVRGRPYVCTVVAPYLIYGTGRRVPHYSTPIGSGGLAEPR